MRVLAFDPGYERLGVAVLEKENGKEVLLYSACVRTSAALEFPERLKKLGEETEVLIKKWKPDAVALEEIFFEKNAKTAMVPKLLRLPGGKKLDDELDAIAVGITCLASIR